MNFIWLGGLTGQDKKFDATGSLPILIRGLEQGMNIFSEQERKLLLDES